MHTDFFPASNSEDVSNQPNARHQRAENEAMMAADYIISYGRSEDLNPAYA